MKNGEARVGLSQSEIEDLARAGEEKRAWKCTTRELGYMSYKTSSGGSINGSPDLWGSTTVASTIHVAARANISFFVTGGTGGVHRPWDAMDISADLAELSKWPMTVFSAGVKSILDIPRTLEVLETNGVTVASYQADEFPAFFSTSSGVKSPMVMDSAEMTAETILRGRANGLTSGFLLACPNPSPLQGVDEASEQAINEAQDKGVVGKDVTPFVLKRVAELTGGDSLASNIALVENNARIGSEVAKAVEGMKKEGFTGNRRLYGGMDANVTVVGGAVVDIVATPRGDIVKGSSAIGSVKETPGGVGANITRMLGRMGTKARLYTAAGNDARGEMATSGIDVVNGGRGDTATYVAVLDGGGDLECAVADMDVMKDIPIPSQEDLTDAKWVVLDGNVPPEKAVSTAKNASGKVMLEPTSVDKATIMAGSGILGLLDLCTPNGDEVIALLGGDATGCILTDAELLQSRMKEGSTLIVTLGEEGVIVVDDKKAERRDAMPLEGKFVDATGAGDALAAGYIHAVVNDIDDPVGFGMCMAAKTVTHRGAAPQDDEVKVVDEEDLL